MSRTILLTGACGGIGKAVAAELDRAGDHLLLLDLDPLSLEVLDDELQGDHTLVPFDLWRNGFDAYGKLAQLIEEDHGKVDAIIHCAAMCGNLRPLVHTSPENWLQNLQVNLTAPLWLFQTLLPLLLKSPAARVIFSLHRSHQQQTAYWHGFGASQAGLENLIAALFAEKNGYPSVGFASVDPGWVDTPQSRAIFPAAKVDWKKPNEVASLYLLALESDLDELTHFAM